MVEMIFLADKLLHLPLHHWDCQRGVGFRWIWKLSRNDNICIELKFAEMGSGGSW